MSMIEAAIAELERQAVYLERIRDTEVIVDGCLDLERLVAALSAQPAVVVPDGWELVPTKMNAAMINAWSGGLTVSSDENAYRTSFQDAWKRVLTAAPQPAQPVDAEDEAYEIGRRDGYSEAVQQIDQLTGGDGEYRYCTDHDPDRHTPGPVEMTQRIVDRFETLNLLRDTEKDGRDQDWGLTTPPAARPFEAVFHGLNEALSVSEVHARMIAAEQRVKALEEALGPFAEVAPIFDHAINPSPNRDEHVVYEWQSRKVNNGLPVTVYVRDFRRARATLKGGEA